MLLIDLVGIQMNRLTGESVLVLREHDQPNRLLPIVVGSAEAASIAIAVQGQTLPRPMTHDVMATLVEGFDAHLDAVELVDFQDGAFIANLAVSGPTGDLRLDTRPSDAIALAIRLHAPLFVSEGILDAVGTSAPSESASVLDDAQIDAEVDQFRDFLEQLAPDDFVIGADESAVGTVDDETPDDPPDTDREPDV